MAIRWGTLYLAVFLALSAVRGTTQTSAKSSDAARSTSQTAGIRSPNSSNAENEYAIEPGTDPENRLVSPFLHHMAMDQKQFWTAPIRLEKKDLWTVVPFVGFTAGLIAADSWLSKQVPDKPNQLNRSLNISNYATYSFVGMAGGSYLLGHLKKDDHLSEAGFLSGEAALNATGVSYLFKVITQRPRPMQDNGNGTFFQGGYSFPSEHAAVAWSVATVFAHEYPGALTQILAYGLASTITITRVTAKQHFPSDAFVGSALGWYFGRQVYRAHHDPELGGTSWGSFVKDDTGDRTRNPAYMSSPYVPMDSWIYPALDRLIALGYVKDAYLDMRPWTRMSCARMVEHAGDLLDTDDSSEEAAGIYRSLTTEFAAELGRLNGDRNLEAKVDSVYTRIMNISGSALRDGYHFGQTITNDFGRPFGNGVNVVSGASASTVVGPFSFYVRGEYQYAPPVNPVSPSALQAMASADFLSDFGPGYMPPGYSVNTGSFNRFRLLEGTVNLTLNNVQFSFGKQTAWFGPGDAGPLEFSDNAEPIPMFRFDTTTPFHIPLLSKFLGPARVQFFIGQLDGLQWVYQPPTLYGPNNVIPQPYLHGDKISFQPTPNFQFGMGLVTIFSGPGLPFTFHNFFRTYYAHTSDVATNPGKRFSAFDFNYRIPGLRKWLTGYLDSMVVDEVSPLGSTRPSLSPGLYIPRVPKIPRMEIRVEGLKTVHPDAGPCCVPGFTYFDRRYISGFTNDQTLMASWVGRAGWGGQGWVTYNFSPRTMLQAAYRNQHVDREFIGGGNLCDVTVKTNITIRDQVTFSGGLQYEHWNFPVLTPGSQSNFTTAVEVTYWPRRGLR
jgi:Capsule assembly protein Wzi/PAP2 superfamily